MHPSRFFPVLFPAMTTPQLAGMMREVDERPYARPEWLTKRTEMSTIRTGMTDSESDRDPKEALHWTPAVLPVVSLE
jgi:hypothetical protein